MTTQPRRIRVLYVVGNFVAGGAERHMLELWSRLDRSRFDVRIATFQRRGQFLPDVEKLGWPIIDLGVPKRIYDHRGIRGLFRLIGEIRRFRPDILQGYLFGPNLFAGLAGGLFAVNYEILTVENVSLAASGSVLLMAYIGGIGFFIGPILGAIVFTFLQSMLSDYTRIWLLYLGILFLGTVLFAPAGLAGILVMHRAAWRTGRLHRLAGPYALAAALALVAAVGVVGLLGYAWVRVPLN